jgi:hypothetical protein
MESFEVRLRERARAWNELERSQDSGPLIGSEMHDARSYGTRRELEVEESIGVRLRVCAGIECVEYIQGRAPVFCARAHVLSLNRTSRK